ncbi:MAG: mechanosensitive ion channel family protein [Geminicoccaceae bacterium]|jgi:MscS family membrane protein|nr:mechanosensitive ion channel family protein [Geminicoccaceae bacterium]
MNFAARRLPQLLLLALILAMTGPVQARDSRPAVDFSPPSTDSPRATIGSLFSEVERAFRIRAASDARNLVSLLGQRALALVDLDQVPPDLQIPLAVETVLRLYVILGRVDLPPLDEIPDLATVRRTELQRWMVPGTGLSILDSVIDDGVPRFRFGPDTPSIAAQLYPLVVDLPRRQGALQLDPYVVLRDGVGPWLTRLLGERERVVTPDWSRQRILDIPLWKILATLLLHLAGLGIAAMAIMLVRRGAGRRDGATRNRVFGFVLPLLLMPLAAGLRLAVADELRLTGPVLAILEIFWVALFTFGAIIFGFAMTRLAADLFIGLARLDKRPGDAQAARLVFRILGLVVAIGILVHALDRLGVPVSGIVTGLGVGGIAVALAAQGTLQNLLGGASLIADRPVRIGELCRFGDRIGTLESIGLRSSRIRSLDRTVVTVPNSDLAGMHIENFARRDRILLHTTLGVRYETTPDQLRAIVADIRALLIAHPEVAPEPARARFVEFGASSLDIEIFAYVRASDYNGYLAVREDLMLRLMDIVSRNGSSVAFPSQTVYLRRDPPDDLAGREAAEAKVAGWRKSGTLPFPAMESGTAGELQDTLPYPPEGSAQRPVP